MLKKNKIQFCVRLRADTVVWSSISIWFDNVDVTLRWFFYQISRNLNWQELSLNQVFSFLHLTFITPLSLIIIREPWMGRQDSSLRKSLYLTELWLLYPKVKFWFRWLLSWFHLSRLHKFAIRCTVSSTFTFIIRFFNMMYTLLMSLSSHNSHNTLK